MPSSVAKICLAVVLLVVSASTIAAHSGATGVVKERMMLMKQMSKDTKALAKMAFGKTAYDAAAVRQHAGEIEKRAGAAMTELFPAGSDVAPSEANADIWRSWDKFTAIAAELEKRGVSHGGRRRSGTGGGESRLRAGGRHVQSLP